MFGWYEAEAEQRQKERLHEAEQERMIRTAGIGRRSRARLRGRAMVWVGSRLVESGRRLQLDDE